MLGPMLRAAAGNGGGGIPTDGLIAHWTMDNIVGSTLVDEMGNYDATLEGSPTTTAGAAGVALVFDGDDDVARLGTIPVSDPLQLLGDFAIAFWVNWNGVGDLYQRVIDKSNSGNGTAGWAVYISAAPFHLYIGVNGTLCNVSDEAVPVSVKTHYIIQCSSNVVSTYKNLNLIKSGVSIPSRPNVETGCSIGSWNHSDGRELNAWLDDTAIYSKALSAAERAQIYNRGI